MPLSAGTRLGSYEIVALLGAGGMGEVYEARDTRLHRTVAIKVLPNTLASDPRRRSSRPIRRQATTSGFYRLMGTVARFRSFTLVLLRANLSSLPMDAGWLTRRTNLVATKCTCSRILAKASDRRCQWTVEIHRHGHGMVESSSTRPCRRQTDASE